MKKHIFTILFASTICNAHANNPAPSELLLHDAIAVYSMRLFCVEHSPELKNEIQSLYTSSKLKQIKVPCDKLKRSDPEITKIMKGIWSNSINMTETEIHNACKGFEEVLNIIEKTHEKELLKYQ